MEAGRSPITVDTIAARAGVGKQTIYRWWPSKYAVVLDAISGRAERYSPVPDTGTLHGDLKVFIGASFRGARDAATAGALRLMAAEAQHNAQAGELLRGFTERRRAALREVLERGQRRGELSADADLELLVEQAYGVLWYRVLVGHAPLTQALADRLVRGLIAQGSTP
jgi:AcrR family transcriptional regulator